MPAKAGNKPRPNQKQTVEQRLKSRVEHTANHNNRPKNMVGVMFISVNAKSVDANNNERASSYRNPFLGHFINVNESQMVEIMRILGINQTGLEKLTSGNEQQEESGNEEGS